ncbi:heterokaryon incompatibility protein-domain-containing protein [Apiospora arundinis]
MFYEFQETPFLDWSESWAKWTGDASKSDGKETGPKIAMDRFTNKVDHFHELLEVYTSKQLSVASDSINGFAGAMKVFTRHDPGFKVIQGLPVFDVSATITTSTVHMERLLAFQKSSLLEEGRTITTRLFPFLELGWLERPSFLA